MDNFIANLTKERCKERRKTQKAGRNSTVWAGNYKQFNMAGDKVQGELWGENLRSLGVVLTAIGSQGG